MGFMYQFSHVNAALNCSQEWGWEGLGRLKMKQGGAWAAHASEGWVGKGLGRLKMKHGEGFEIMYH